MALQSRLSGGPWNPEPYDHWLAEQFEMCEEADREREEAAAAAAAEADREREEAAAAEAEAREHELLLYHEGEPGEAPVFELKRSRPQTLRGYARGAECRWLYYPKFGRLPGTLTQKFLYILVSREHRLRGREAPASQTPGAITTLLWLLHPLSTQ